MSSPSAGVATPSRTTNATTACRMSRRVRRRLGLLLRALVERAERHGRLPAQWADLAAVVLVRELGSAVVELELEQRRESAVARRHECQARLVGGGRGVETVVPRLRLAKKRQRNEQDDDRRERDSGRECERG